MVLGEDLLCAMHPFFVDIVILAASNLFLLCFKHRLHFSFHSIILISLIKRVGAVVHHRFPSDKDCHVQNHQNHKADVIEADVNFYPFLSFDTD